MNVTAGMSHNGYLFMLHSPPRESRKFGAVIPHAFCYDPAVVCDHSLINHYKILGMQGRSHHVYIFQGDLGHDKQSSYVQTGQ